MHIIVLFILLGLLLFLAGFLMMHSFRKQTRKIDINNAGWWDFNFIVKGTALVFFLSMLLSVIGLTLVYSFGTALFRYYFS